jgi:hypothetical protein
MRMVLASLGVIALTGCEAPPLPRPTPLLRSVPVIAGVETGHSPVVSIADFTWRHEGTFVLGTFTLTNNGRHPVDRVFISCDVHGARVRSVVGWLAVNIQEPLPAGSTRTFTNVSLDGSAVSPEQTVECHRIISAQVS